MDKGERALWLHREESWTGEPWEARTARWGCPGGEAAEPCGPRKGPELGPAQHPGSLRGSARAGLGTLAVPSLLGVCVLRMGKGHGVAPGRERGSGQQGGSLCHSGRPDEALGQAGPLQHVRAQNGQAQSGRTRPAPPCHCITDASLCDEGPHTAVSHSAHSAQGRSRRRGSAVCGRSVQTRALGSHHTGVQASPCAQPDPPAPRPWSTRPQPCAPSRGGGCPASTAPGGGGPEALDWGPRPEGQRRRGDCFIFIRKATKKKLDPPPL